MDIWEIDKLLLFIVFVVPGFISLKCHDLISPRAARSSSGRLIDAITYSSINYALLLWPIALIEGAGIRTSHPKTYFAFYVFVLLIAPACWTALAYWLRKTQFFQGSMPHPTLKPWDYVFAQRKPYWAIVTMKDGSKIAGRYDDQSFASSMPAKEQLYLQEAWVLNEDGGFERPRANTAGILILSEDVITVELFKLINGESHERREPVSSGKSGEGLPASEAA